MRECNICPPEVVRCAHFDGRVVMLHKDQYANDLLFLCGSLEPVVWSTPYEHGDYNTEFMPRRLVTIKEADAAFRDAERELLSVAVG